MENKTELQILEMADQFIDVANRLVTDDAQDIGRVAAAVRFAAARFSAHEASFKAGAGPVDKAHALEWFTDQYRKMLDDNLEEHIRMKQAQG